jgi:hypothetical protein
MKTDGSLDPARRSGFTIPVVGANEMPHRLLTRLLMAATLVGLASGVAVALAPAASAATAPVTAAFTINGRGAAHSSNSNPIKLDPGHPAQVTITVNNNGTNPITVVAVALSGRALDIPFFDFETETALQVQPGAQQTQQYTLDFAPLNNQGDGLIPASIRILDDHRRVLAAQNFTADVRGRITSLFGLFAIEVTVFTIVLFAGALFALARGKLHENRFRRALRFMWPGIGLGIVIVFGLAILRTFVPAPGHWLPIVLLCAAIAFGLGYLTPNPANDELVPDPDPEPATEPVPVAADPRSTLTPAGAPARQPPVGE